MDNYLHNQIDWNTLPELSEHRDDQPIITPHHHSSLMGNINTVQIISEKDEALQIETKQGSVQPGSQLTCQCASAENFRGLIPGMVEDSWNQATQTLVEAMRSEKKAILLEMEAMRSHMDQQFTAFGSILDEVLKRTGHNPSSRFLPQTAESPEAPTFQLHFKGTLPSTFATFMHIRDHKGDQLEVELQDDSGNLVKAGPESSLKIKIVVLDGDFDKDDWTKEEFTRSILQPRKDKGPLLKGEYDIFLSEGVATVGNISCTDNSSKVAKNGHFRLGVQAVKGLNPGVRIKEAVSEPFKVKERRCLSHEKQSKRQKICSAAATQKSVQAGAPPSMMQTNTQHLDLPTNEGELQGLLDNTYGAPDLMTFPQQAESLIQSSYAGNSDYLISNFDPIAGNKGYSASLTIISPASYMMPPSYSGQTYTSTPEYFSCTSEYSS